MIPKSEFQDWKDSRVTQEMVTEVKEAAEEVAAELINRRTSTPQDDAYLRGYIRGVQASLEWVPTFEEDDNG